MRNAALLFSIVMVFLCLVTPSYAIQRTVTGSMDRSGFQTDTDGQLYLIHGKNNRTELIRVDVPERKATTVFTIGSLDGQITIGNGEICFRNIFVQPLFASHIILELDSQDRSVDILPTDIYPVRICIG